MADKTTMLHRPVTSPFSARGVQKKSLFGAQVPDARDTALQTSFALSTASVDVTVDKKLAVDTINEVETEWTIGSFTEEAEEEASCELSDSDATFGASRAMTEAISVTPNAVPVIDYDGAHLGFWADVGASTFDMEDEPEEQRLPTHSFEDISDWEAESGDEEDDTLLPWDY